MKADKEEEEVNTDSLDLEKEEEGNISVGTSIYPFSRRGALKLIPPLQLLFRQCKRRPPSFSEVDFTLMLMVIDLIKSNRF